MLSERGSGELAEEVRRARERRLRRSEEATLLRPAAPELCRAAGQEEQAEAVAPVGEVMASMVEPEKRGDC